MAIHADANANNERLGLILGADGEAALEEPSLIAEIWARTMRPIGWVASVVMAAGMTFVLFFFMQSLISTSDFLDKRITVVRIIDATMPEIELVVIEERDRPEPIDEVTEQQPELQEKYINLDSGPSLNIERATVEIEIGLDFSVASIASTDGDYLPLVAISPQYPELARARDIEGWCIVSFTVDAMGNVVENTIEVVDAEPPSIFDRSSIRAAARFKFQPRVKNGVGVDVPGVQYLFTYRFED